MLLSTKLSSDSRIIFIVIPPKRPTIKFQDGDNSDFVFMSGAFIAKQLARWKSGSVVLASRVTAKENGYKREK